jgi:flagellar biosynthetic protein FlhB
MLVPLLLDNVVLMAHLTDVIAQAGVAVHASAVLWWRAIIGLALIGVVDVVVQRRKHAVRLKMSPREVRDERAQAEGRPESKQRRRALGLRRARNLRVDAIRRATVVITNPTRVAVALRYAPPLIDVPTVVARGADLMAPFVRAVARLFAVPVIEAPELARSLYLHVDIDEPIPEECYAAVAAIFTWIVRSRGALRRGDEEDM